MATDRLGDVVIRPVRDHHAFEGCVEQLATAIRLGVYPAGSALPPEREMAERMGVSRATLREAIAALRRPAMASRNVARETAIRSASSRSGGRAEPNGNAPSRMAVASCSTHPSNAWWPRTGRMTTSPSRSVATGRARGTGGQRTLLGSSTWRMGPVNQFFADTCHQIVSPTSAPTETIGA